MRKERGFGGQMLEIGSVVYVRYLDHVLFKDAGLSAYRPFVREAVGWLDHEDDGFIRLVWERLAEPMPSGELKQRVTGVVILKSAILGVWKFDGKNYLNQRAHSIHHEYTKEEKTEDGRDPGNAGNAPAPAFLREEGGDIQRCDKPPARRGVEA
jgi:hypothetical protein